MIPRKKTEAAVTCLSCGKTTNTFILDLPSGGLSPTAPCPKCNNTAYTNNLSGLWEYMRESAKQIVLLKEQGK